MAAKWFYKAQEQVMDVFRIRFEQTSCNYQIVTKNQVIESYYVREKDGEVKELVVNIVKHGTDNVSVIINEQTPFRSWKAI